MSDVSDEANAVIEANRAFYEAFNAKDPAAMEAAWAEAAAITCIHPGWNVLTGREDVLASWRSILNNPQQARIVAGGAVVQFFGDCAVVTCRELVGGNPLAATNIFVREQGRWRLAHHQSGAVFQL